MPQTIYAPPRLMPDPLPYPRGYGMLTKREHATCLRILGAVESRPCASIVLTWCSEETDAWIALARMGYVRDTADARVGKSSAPMRWHQIELTSAGETYLRQMREIP